MMVGGRAYLDHAATSPMPEAVLEVYTDALRTVGNPASTHGHGQRASQLLEAARDSIARMVGCDHAELILTAGGTESINLALKGLYWSRRRSGSGPVVLIAEGEHHATMETAEWLRDVQGAELVGVPIDENGLLTPGALEAAIAAAGADRVAVISFLWANNEVGTLQPVRELCAVAAAHGVPAHVDAVSALGQVPIDFAASGASALSLSAHKVGGPVGVGAVILGRRVTVEPLLHGGSQQRSRSGTQDVAGAVAFAAALEMLLDEEGRPRRNGLAHLGRLRDRLISGVREVDPTAVLRGASVGAGRLPGNAHFTFPGCQGDSLVFLLDGAGVSVSVGSACQAGVAELSHVLLAMGVAPDDTAGALRFTLGQESTESEVDALLAALPAALRSARAAGLS